MVVNKLNFITSSQRLTGSWLDAVQGSVRFDGVERTSIFDEPTTFDEAGWLVNQRDPLLDFEHSPNSAVGNIAWGGRIISSDGESFGPPSTTVVNGLYYVWVHGGRFQTVEREVVEWNTQLVQVALGAEQYLYLDPTTLNVVSSVPEPSSQQVSLGLITIDNSGVLTDYIDLRSSSFTEDFSSRTRSLLFENTEQSNNYVLGEWERLLVDTSGGSIYVDLPATPEDNTEVSIVDSNGFFHLYPVLLRPAPQGDNLAGTTINGIDNDAFALNRRYGVYTLLYSLEKNGWYFIQNQEEKVFERGSFISCGGRVVDEGFSGTLPVAGTSPTVYLDEVDPPIYEIIDGIPHLLYPKTSGIYSNPSLTDSQGLHVVHMDSRCRDDDHSYISGGNTGFSAQETLLRRVTSTELLDNWETDTLPAISPLPVGERQVLFELLNRVSYSILVGSWLHTQEFEQIVLNTVSSTTQDKWYDEVLSQIPAELLSEFEEFLGYMNA